MNAIARLLLATTVLASAATALTAQETQVARPQIRTVPGSGPTLLVYSPGAVSCADGAVTPVELLTPYGGAQSLRFENIPDVELTFRIDPDGRARGIEKKGERYAWPPNDDAEPALAGSRFAAGRAHTGCTIRYGAKAIPLAEATAAQLGAFWAIPHTDKSQDRAVWKALQAPGATCYETPLRPQVARYPDYKLAGRPGVPDYAVIAFDVDKTGKSVAVRTLTSSGNPAFDKNALTAAQGTSFEAGAPRTGCVVRYGKSSRVPLVAPALDKDAFKPAEACKDEPTWLSKPPLRFPSNFLRRSIQGWAVLRFDVAPWGAVGNVRVLASEPADEFGVAARSIVEMARKPSSERGYSGCIQVVSFKMADRSAGLSETTETPVDIAD